jgi:hypothetical protein
MNEMTSEIYMRDEMDLASPGAGQRREAWLRESLETKNNVHLI